jgi:hypothetical protein
MNTFTATTIVTLETLQHVRPAAAPRWVEHERHGAPERRRPARPRSP